MHIACDADFAMYYSLYYPVILISVSVLLYNDNGLIVNVLLYYITLDKVFAECILEYLHCKEV